MDQTGINRAIWTVFLAALVLAASGCMRATQKEVLPYVDVPERFVQDRGVLSGHQMHKDWWKEFNDPVLNSLVQKVLKNNHDLKIAAERVIQVRNEMILTAAARVPSVDIQLNIQRQRYQGLVEGADRGYTAGTIGLNWMAFYEIDLWRRLLFAEQAAAEAVLQAQQNRAVVIQAVIAETVGFYLQAGAIKKRLEIVRDKVKEAEQIVNILQDRYRRGLVSAVDVLQAKANLSSLKAEVPILTKRLHELTQRLSVLSGEYPETDIAVRQEVLNTLESLSPVPPGLPSELLRRRPDILAAEATLRRMGAMVYVAEAARFPRISLTASYGWSSNALKSLLSPSSRLWQMAMGLFSPVLDAGKKRAELRIAESRYRQALAEYSKVVLNAFFEVENALLTRRLLFQRRQDLRATLKEMEREHGFLMDRYRKGLVDIIAVLKVRQRIHDLQEAILQTELDILLNRVVLYKALGGGWNEEKTPQMR